MLSASRLQVRAGDLYSVLRPVVLVYSDWMADKTRGPALPFGPSFVGFLQVLLSSCAMTAHEQVASAISL